MTVLIKKEFLESVYRELSTESMHNIAIISENNEWIVGRDRQSNAMLNKAIEYINDNYQRSITLNELAEYTYVSTYYISRIFKKEIGKNFVDYLNEIRINKAKVLLKNNTYKTYEVAELVGIQDPHYFSKLFKKYTNMTPTDYRVQGSVEE